MAGAFDLNGKTALVTGGASGIGEAIVRRFAEAGASILIVDVNEERGRALEAEIPAATMYRCDITEEQDVANLFQSISKLDVLVNNAGVALVGGIEETALDDFERLMRVNVRGVFLMTRAAIPLLVANSGNIVNIASVAGLVGVKKRFAYCATKGAVVAMTRQVALDYPKELRCNCICPGTVHTPFVDGYLDKYHKHEKEKMIAELSARQPVGRMGKPEEIASLALYLASDEAAFVTGSAITIDGGWTAA